MTLWNVLYETRLRSAMDQIRAPSEVHRGDAARPQSFTHTLVRERDPWLGLALSLLAGTESSEVLCRLGHDVLEGKVWDGMG